METFFYPSATGLCDIAAYRWLPDGEPKAAIQIVHGMAEHAMRYCEIAEYLNSIGYAVYANDHAGHGASVNGNGKKGFFASENGWDLIIDDVMVLHKIIRREHPGLPNVLYGHSMGSFIARACASRFPMEFDAFVFSGTAGKNPAVGIARLLARLRIGKTKGDVPDKKLDSLAFGSYNKGIESARTRFDWLTRDKEVVDEYIKDDMCGFTFTSAAFRDLFDGLKEISGRKWAAKVENVPICMIAGKADPVGAYGKGVMEVCENLRKTGHTKVVLQLYGDGRHEMHNELNRKDVYRGIAAFLRGMDDNKMPPKQ